MHYFGIALAACYREYTQGIIYTLKNTMHHPRDIVDAIVSSSPEGVKALIGQGYKINTPLPHHSIYNFNTSRISDDFEPNAEGIVALDTNNTDGRSCVAYPLHIAIVSLYKAASRIVYDYSSKHDYSSMQCLEVIQILLHYGADWKLGCKGLLILHLEDYKWISFPEYPGHSGRNQPIHLAMFLKKYQDHYSNEYMDKAIRLIQAKVNRQIEKEKEGQGKLSSLKTVAVLKSVANTYKSMLFSEDFSDVTFQCSDGVSIPAHKNILAASSPYFERAFKGDWAENNLEGIWPTIHSSSMMKSFLTLIYTGSKQECEKILADNENDPIGLLDLACEYDMKPLVLISIDNCIKHLKLDNVRMIMQSAQRHSCERLKIATFAYVNVNARKALMRPDMVSLATEDPELWAELGMFLNGKRPRADNGK